MLKTVSSITNAIGALNYKGTWNASTNSPALASGVGTKGDYYVVSVAGSTTLDGISNWGVGDWAVYNGAAWQRVEGGADLNGVNLTFTGTASGPTYETSNLTTGATLTNNSLSADGTDTNIDLLANPKGTGGFGINGAPTGVVAGVGFTSKFCVKNENSSAIGGFVQANNTTAASGSGIFACRSRGTLAAPTVVQSGDNLASLFFLGNDGTDLAIAAEIKIDVDGTPGNNDMPGRIVFKTTPDGSEIPVEAMRINSSGNVGINTVNPTTKLNVVDSTSTNPVVLAKFSNTNGASGGGAILQIDRSLNTRVTALQYSTSNTAEWTVGLFREGGSTSQKYVVNLGNDYTISSASKFVIDTSGNVLIGTTSAVSGGAKLQTVDGITFPASQLASTNANTLDDYEEGTWTPALSADGGASGQAYIQQLGMYTKIGDVVAVQGTIYLNGVGTLTGNVGITLPFSTLSGTSGSVAALFITGLTTSTVAECMTIASGSNFAYLRIKTAAAASYSLTAQADIATNTYILFQITYRVAS
jgi:hypothetical protein